MRTFLAIAVLCLASACTAAGFDPYEGSKPIAVFTQTDPWALVIGSDTPRVAIYENGDVVFRKKVDDGYAYHRAALDMIELQNVRERFRRALAQPEVEPYYDVAPGITDQSRALLYFNDGGREIVTSVYGLTAGSAERLDAGSLGNNWKAIVPPDELLALHEWLSGLDYPDSAAWTPKYVEVMLWNRMSVPDTSIQWPRAWPSLNSDRAIRRGSSYSIYLDGAVLPSLREFLATRTEKGAVEIEGRKMAASFRFAFPGEPLWRKAFAESGRRTW